MTKGGVFNQRALIYLTAGLRFARQSVSSGGIVRTVLLRRHTVAVVPAAGLGVLGISGPAVASGTYYPGPGMAVARVTRPTLRAAQGSACPPAQPGRMTCMSIVRAAQRSNRWAAGGAALANVSYGPTDLQHAYGLSAASAHRGNEVTVAIVDAFNDPLAGKDLGRFRHLTGLPPCTKANGCLHIVNQAGKTGPLPASNVGWSVEISLDLDMVSAVCPKCHILLVEAKNALTVNLGAAVNTAVKKGAKYVSNSWGGPQFSGESHFSHFFNHPGTVVSFASGDFGFGPTFPANLQYVTSIGGTTLRKTTGGRGWTESVWGSATRRRGTASGCSNQSKPSWQRFDPPGGCTRRTQNDVAAVANPATGVRVFDSFPPPRRIGGGGTNASTPLIPPTSPLAREPKARPYPRAVPHPG